MGGEVSDDAEAGLKLVGVRGVWEGMKWFQNMLIGVFAFSTLAVGGVLLQQRGDLAAAKAEAATLAAEQVALREQLAEARRAAMFAVTVEGGGVGVVGDVVAPNREMAAKAGAEAAARGEWGGGGGRARMEALMKNPDFMAAMAVRNKARLDREYADLFRRLNLPPTQLERFKGLLAERQNARMDVLAAARTEGLNPRDNREELQQLMRMAQDELAAAMQAEIGAEAFATFQAYERSAPQRATVGQLEQRLSYSAAPLTPVQSDQLVMLLAQAGTPGGGRGGAVVTDQVLTQATAILGREQLEALRALQAEQEAGRAIGEAFRFGPGGGPGGE